MQFSGNTGINHSPIYKKALDIFKLSRHVATYITDDKDIISMYRSGNKSDIYADNLVMNAFRLVPKIVEAETEVSPQKKLNYAKSLHYFIDKIYNDCVKLENVVSHGKDFLKMLRVELKSMRKIHSRYLNSLL